VVILFFVFIIMSFCLEPSEICYAFHGSGTKGPKSQEQTMLPRAKL